MYLPKLREVREALTSFFTPAYTSKFPKIPYAPPEEFRGFPEYHEEHCVGCGTCAQVCPTSAIEVIDDTALGTRRLQVDYGSCIHCGQCNEHCITGQGITPTAKYSLPVTDKRAPEIFETVEKELAICDYCGDVIACWDHLDWIKERLGAKAYAHPNLLLSAQRHQTELATSRPKDRVRREDYGKLLCPKCRRRVVMEDEF
ncbi:MAG TPA: 4Fe-4S binding protein [bacterium]|nr:4Fe-4S binding protein [bacterium]